MFGLVNRFIGHLQVVTTNNYNTIAISTLYSSLENKVYFSQSVTRRFLVTALTMAIPMPPAQHGPSHTPVQNGLNSTCSLLITFRHGPHRKPLPMFSRSVAFLIVCCLATGTCWPSRCPEMALVYHCIAAAAHATLCMCIPPITAFEGLYRSSRNLVLWHDAWKAKQRSLGAAR
jgi:hypothetical protein